MAVTPQPPHTNHLNQPPPPPFSLISIDMSSLSHSELHSLSLLSSQPPPPPSQNDVVSTSAQFSSNPSQTTSHQQPPQPPPHTLPPRLHHHHNHHNHHRRFSLLNQERLESNLIVSFLKKHLPFHPSPENVAIEIVNRNGVVVDLAALEEGEAALSDELLKRAQGRDKEEELLEMLAELDGEWCSRRKKRRVVDASLLGDALPLGWKIIVALRRKDGRFSPYCRSFISPTGEQLSSCKEVSSYLQSYFGINDAKLVRDNRVEHQQLQTVDTDNHTRINYGNGSFMRDHSDSTLRNTSASVEHEKEASIMGIDNLPDVQVCDLYECHLCKMSFDVKDKYLQHMLTLHQKTTKRYTLDPSVGDKVIIKDGKSEQPKKRKRHKHGSSVSDGVIINNGKYECQFCHKVFEERRRYLGHVGNHVKGSIKMPEDSVVHMNGSARAPCVDKSPTVISNSRMDALIEIAQNSIQDMNIPVIEKEPSSVDNVERLTAAETSQVTDANRKTKENSGSCLTEFDMEKSCREGKTFSAELYPSETAIKILSASADETAYEGFEEGTTLSQELHLPYNRFNEVSMNDADDDHFDSLPDEHEGEDTGEDKGLSSELDPHDKMGEISRTYEFINVPAFCLNEFELEDDVTEIEILSTETDPLAEMSKMSTTDEEVKEQSYTCNIVVSKKNSCPETSMTPDDASRVAEHASGIGRSKSAIAKDKNSADEPAVVDNINYVCSKDKASDPKSSCDKIQMKYVNICEPQHAQNYDDGEHVAVSDKNRASGSTLPQSSLNSSSTFDEIFGKAGQDICSLDQNLESVTGLEYMKLDVIEPQMYKYNAMSREDSISFYDVSMDLENNIGLGLGLDNSKSQSEYPQELAGSCLTTTVCVWCCVQFSHEIVEVEPQPDSVGFMCPACRAKISKQFNELESNFSLSSPC